MITQHLTWNHHMKQNRRQWLIQSNELMLYHSAYPPSCHCNIVLMKICSWFHWSSNMSYSISFRRTKWSIRGPAFIRTKLASQKTRYLLLNLDGTKTLGNKINNRNNAYHMTIRQSAPGKHRSHNTSTLIYQQLFELE